MSGYRRISPLPKPLGSLVQRAAAGAYTKRGFAEGRLLRDWPLIAGDELATRAVPLKIASQCLHLRTEPAWAMELQYQEPLILERIATFFGYRLITRLVIHQGPVPAVMRPMPSAPVEPLPDSPLFTGHEDGPLKAALRRLGGALHQRRETCNPSQDAS